MPVDRRGRLDEAPFGYRITADGRVLVTHDGRPAVTVAGAKAVRLAAALADATDEHARQLLLARVTGNFKRGNER